MSDRIQWLWMQNTFGTGSRRAHEIYERYGGPEDLLSLSPGQIERDGFLSREEKRAVLTCDLRGAERTILSAEALGAQILTPDSAEYPESLRNIHAIPLVLYATGDLTLLRENYLISMVGTRSPDEYGLRAARKLSGEIASLGGVVVSGLAVGIDAACHNGALEAGGKTVAFLAAGLDVDYPSKNHELRKRIERNGLVLTEYRPGDVALPGHFPVRNRLISGVSMATVVVQSGRRSGTMLTAAHALAQNRDLFAVPGGIFSANMEGCNALLAEGAAPALSGEDILRRYQSVYGYPLNEPEHPRPPQELCPAASAKEQPARQGIPDYLTERQAAVLSRLLAGPVSVEDLAAETQAQIPALLAVVTQLEIFGLAETLPGRMLRAASRA